MVIPSSSGLLHEQPLHTVLGGRGCEGAVQVSVETKRQNPYLQVGEPWLPEPGAQYPGQTQQHSTWHFLSTCWVLSAIPATIKA